MNPSEIMQLRDAKKLEMRNLIDTAKARKDAPGMTTEERAKFSAIEAEVLALQGTLDAEVKASELTKRAASVVVEQADAKPVDEGRAFIGALRENRALTIGANGPYSKFNTLFEEGSILGPLLGKATVQRGLGTERTMMELFNPGVGITRVDENEDSFSVDTAAYAPVQVKLYPYVADIPVSTSFLDFEPDPVGVLSKLYQKTLVGKLGTEIVSGAVNTQGASGGCYGVVTDTGITQHLDGTEGGLYTLADMHGLVGMALEYKLPSQLTLVLNAASLGAIRALDTYGQYLVNQGDKIFFDGVEVVISSGIVATAAANATGVIMAVLGDFSGYGIGIAKEMKVSLLPEVAGCLTQHVRIVSYINGLAVAKTNFWKLISLHAA
jgi:HK97 family phage major capsid protein